MDVFEYESDTFYAKIMVTVEEVTNAIKRLDGNKACGADDICSEHIKCEDKVLVPLLSLCFTSLLMDFYQSHCCQLCL